MASLLSKRKRRADVEHKSEQRLGAQQERLESLLKQHFESKFVPLNIVESPPRTQENEFEESEASLEESEDWEGIMDERNPEVVDHNQFESEESGYSWRRKHERRSFMSNKPPSASATALTPMANVRAGDAAEDAAEALNIKNDFDLQRLLRESTLLKSSRTDSRGSMPSAVHPSEEATDLSLTLHGTNRHKALDLRLQNLGAKGSLYRQKKMPLSHRFGIVGKRRSQERERRREAHENGIILERAVKDKKATAKKSRRERGVGGPSIGKMKGGTLKLSRSDVRNIQGDHNGLKMGGTNKKRR